jgi:adenylate kinase family enzyme
MTEIAEKISAGKMLTKFLKEVADEETTVIIDGKPHVVTKAEALARILWTMCLGGNMEYYAPDGTVKVRYYEPDKKTAEFIFNRTEGTPVSGTAQFGRPAIQKIEKFNPGMKSRLSVINSEEETDVQSE